MDLATFKTSLFLTTCIAHDSIPKLFKTRYKLVSECTKMYPDLQKPLFL